MGTPDTREPDEWTPTSERVSPDDPICNGHRWRAERDQAIAERDHWIRLWNRLEAAVSHHKKNLWGDHPVEHDDDVALYKARDKILADAAKGAKPCS